MDAGLGAGVPEDAMDARLGSGVPEDAVDAGLRLGGPRGRGGHRARHSDFSST